jgi:hypothetical protein
MFLTYTVALLFLSIFSSCNAKISPFDHIKAMLVRSKDNKRPLGEEDSSSIRRYLEGNERTRTSAARQESQGETITAVVNAIIGGISLGIYFVLARKVLEVMNSLKPSEDVGDSVPPNIRRFLKANITLNPHEVEILANVIDPNQISTSFKGLGGLSDIKRSLVDCVYDLLSQEPTIESSSSSAVTRDSSPKELKEKNQNGYTMKSSAPVIASQQAPITNSLLSNKPVQGILLFGPPGNNHNLVS